MKHNLLAVIILIVFFGSFGTISAQETGTKEFYTGQVGWTPPKVLNHETDHVRQSRDYAFCGTDTILYPYFKELTFSAPNDSFFIDAMVGNVRTASQAYHLSGSVNVLGVQFWGAAYSTSPAFQILPVIVYLYTVDGLNMPLTRIDSATVVITQEYDFYEAYFPLPHTVSSNFAVAVKSTLNDTLAVVTNNAGRSYQNPFYGEGLGWRRFGSGTWNSAFSFFGQDLEYMIFPIVNYGLNTSFSASDSDICRDSSVIFTNQSSELYHDRMFNLLAFDDYFYPAVSDSAFYWNYGTDTLWSTVSPASQQYTTAGSYTVSLAAELLGYYSVCADTMTLEITVNPSYYVDTTIHICLGDEFQFGTNTLSTEGIYNESFSSVAGCDSSVHLTLNVDSVDTGVTQSEITLTALAGGALFQWLECDNGYQPLSGEVNPVFIAAANGNYAVQVNQGTCYDTSACFPIVVTGLDENFAAGFSVSPNPAGNVLNVFSEQDMVNAMYEVYDYFGRLLIKGQMTERKLQIDLSALKPGVFTLRISDESDQMTMQFVKY